MIAKSEVHRLQRSAGGCDDNAEVRRVIDAVFAELDTVAVLVNNAAY